MWSIAVWCGVVCIAYAYLDLLSGLAEQSVGVGVAHGLHTPARLHARPARLNQRG